MPVGKSARATSVHGVVLDRQGLEGQAGGVDALLPGGPIGMQKWTLGVALPSRSDVKPLPAGHETSPHEAPPRIRGSSRRASRDRHDREQRAASCTRGRRPSTGRWRDIQPARGGAQEAESDKRLVPARSRAARGRASPEAMAAPGRTDRSPSGRRRRAPRGDRRATRSSSSRCSCSSCSSSFRSATRSGSASTTGGSSGGSPGGDPRAGRTTADLWHDQLFWTVDPEHRLLHGVRRAGADGARARPRAHREPEDRGKDVLPSAYYFPSLASSTAITAIAIYMLSADGLFNSVLGIDGPARHTPWFGKP